MTLRVAGLTALVACAIAASACDHTPPPPPLVGTVDRVTTYDPSKGSSGGSYFTLEGDVTQTYTCPVYVSASCMTLAKGDKISYRLDQNRPGDPHVITSLDLRAK